MIVLTVLTAAAQQHSNPSPPTETSLPRAVEHPSAVRATIAEKTRDLASTDPARVAAAAYLLGEMGGAAAETIPQLAAVLGDSRKVDPARYRKARTARAETTSPGREAATALSKIGEPAVEVLINVLKSSPNAVARQNAAWALGIIQGRSAPGGLAHADVPSSIEN